MCFFTSSSANERKRSAVATTQCGHSVLYSQAPSDSSAKYEELSASCATGKAAQGFIVAVEAANSTERQEYTRIPPPRLRFTPQAYEPRLPFHGRLKAGSVCTLEACTSELLTGTQADIQLHRQLRPYYSSAAVSRGKEPVHCRPAASGSSPSGFDLALKEVRVLKAALMLHQVPITSPLLSTGNPQISQTPRPPANKSSLCMRRPISCNQQGASCPYSLTGEGRTL